MFEGLVSDLLVKYLGQYIKDLNKEQLSIGVWGGNVVLENLEIKEEALDAFNIPFRVKKGFIGKLSLVVPWKNLKSKPVIVIIENVFLLAQPQYNYAEYDHEKEEKNKQKTKKARLENAELVKSFNEEGVDEKGDSFAQRLATKVVDNLQIQIKNVHVRFEDFTTSVEFPFAFGICIQNLSVSSTDENWDEKFIENRTSKLIYKIGKLECLSMYYDPIDQSLADLSTPQFAQIFTQLIMTEKSLSYLNSPHHFLLKPITNPKVDGEHARTTRFECS